MSCLSFLSHHKKYTTSKKVITKSLLPVYGEWIRTFTFGPTLPIVQPGGSLPLSIATVPPKNCEYVEDESGTGILVPCGIYRVKWFLNPSERADVTLLVNGESPLTTTTSYAYTHQIKQGTSSLLGGEYYVIAPLKENLISIVNTGDTLFTLESLPNTSINEVSSILTHVQIERIGRYQKKQG